MLPSPEELQFERAVPVSEVPVQKPSGPACALCKEAVTGQYYHVHGSVVCPVCARRIEAAQQSPPAASLFRAALYGMAAALAGGAIYAFAAIVTGFEIGLISILIGIMVGKAIRFASKGLGGRPQQILAVALTYLAITTSYIPVFIYHAMNRPPTIQGASATRGQIGQGNIGAQSNTDRQNSKAAQQPVSLGRALLYLLGLALAAPFLRLGSDISGLITIAIIFFGLSRAWKLTGRPEIPITGPYGPEGA